MKNWVAAILGLIILGLLIQTRVAYGLNFPKASGYVNDFAGILANETRQSLEQKLVELEKETGIEMAVVTVASLKDLSIEDYAVRLFEDWQIGKKNKDNGLLLLIAPNERQLRIEVGYGLEPVLTDSQAGRIIRNIIRPEFKKSNYDAGVVNGVEAITQVVSGEAVDFGEEGGEESSFWLLLILPLILFSYLGAFLARSKHYWPGGLIGAVSGGILGWTVFIPSGTNLFISLMATLAMAFLLGLLGLGFDYLLSKNYQKRKARGLPTSWWSSGGGFFSSGSHRRFGGGSSGGGGSGGGGSSGSW